MRSDEIRAPRVLPVACPEAGRGWARLADPGSYLEVGVVVIWVF